MTRCVTTLEVLKDYFMFRLNESTACRNAETSEQIQADCKYVSPDALEMIRSLANEAEERHRECFDVYINEVFNESPKDTFEIIKKLQEIAEKLFEDNCINWGRLIALISFIGYFTYRYACQMQNIELASTFACKMIEWLTSYITCKAGMWIECNGGWVNFSFVLIDWLLNA